MVKEPVVTGHVTGVAKLTNSRSAKGLAHHINVSFGRNTAPIELPVDLATYEAAKTALESNRVLRVAVVLLDD